mmetsp:Transcript_12569/g.24586  ORF Transcript_12569/g.24586 Transcript_12569/m.24586 type:complete len:83 (-) Transcript_12569:87-335(-)
MTARAAFSRAESMGCVARSLTCSNDLQSGQERPEGASCVLCNKQIRQKACLQGINNGSHMICIHIGHSGLEAVPTETSSVAA